MPSCLAALYPSKRACARGALLLSFIKYAYLSLVVKLRFAFIYRKFHWRAGRRSLVQATSIDLLSKSSQAVSGWKPAGQSVLAPHSWHPLASPLLYILVSLPFMHGLIDLSVLLFWIIRRLGIIRIPWFGKVLLLSSFWSVPLIPTLRAEDDQIRPP
jgi:hypothetical protein